MQGISRRSVLEQAMAGGALANPAAAAAQAVGVKSGDLPALTSQYDPPKPRLGQSSYASAIDACLWDILGKADGLKAYKIHLTVNWRCRTTCGSR